MCFLKKLYFMVPKYSRQQDKEQNINVLREVRYYRRGMFVDQCTDPDIIKLKSIIMNMYKAGNQS